MPSYDDEALNGLTEILENLESDDEADEPDEARRPAARTPRVASGSNLYRQRPAGQSVTQVQLQAALARVGQQIKTNADATKALSTRVAAEAVARRKESVALRKDLKKARDMSIFPLLLQKPPELDVTKSADGRTVTDVKVKSQTDNLLPLILLMGGLGGGGEGKDDDNSMMLLAVTMMNR